MTLCDGDRAAVEAGGGCEPGPRVAQAGGRRSMAASGSFNHRQPEGDRLRQLLFRAEACVDPRDRDYTVGRAGAGPSAAGPALRIFLCRLPPVGNGQA